jgi:hypothetical protein
VRLFTADEALILAQCGTIAPRRSHLCIRSARTPDPPPRLPSRRLPAHLAHCGPMEPPTFLACTAACSRSACLFVLGVYTCLIVQNATYSTAASPCVRLPDAKTFPAPHGLIAGHGAGPTAHSTASVWPRSEGCTLQEAASAIIMGRAESVRSCGSACADNHADGCFTDWGCQCACELCEAAS